MNVFAALTAQLIEALEAGVVPWRRPWRIDGLMPHNAITGRRYSGLNSLLLATKASIRGYSTAAWIGFQQAKRAGGHVRAGESSTLGFYWRTFRECRNAETGEIERFSLARPIPCAFRVWNLDQVEDLEAPAAGCAEPLPSAEDLIAGYLAADGPSLAHRPQPRAYYQPHLDAIVLPPVEYFESPQAHCRVLLHELIHSTGHPRRLNRDLSHTFGSSPYAREELLAELGAAYLCADAGIAPDVPLSAAYCASWIRALQGDAGLLLTASSGAQRAHRWIVDPAVRCAEPREIAA